MRFEDEENKKAAERAAVLKGETEMNYCPYCNQMVAGRKHINWFILIIATFFTSGFWLLVYLPYYLFFKSPSCPLCGCEKLQ